MTTPPSKRPDGDLPALPAGLGLPWLGAVVVAPDETVLAIGRFDLDAELRFSDGWIVLTNKRVIADEPAFAAGGAGRAGGPRSWAIDASIAIIDVPVKGSRSASSS